MEQRNNDWTFQCSKKPCHVGGSHRVGVGSLHESDCPHPVSQRFREETAKCQGDHSADTVPQEDGWLITGQGQYRLQVTGQVCGLSKSQPPEESKKAAQETRYG